MNYQVLSLNGWKSVKLGELGSFFGGVTSIKKSDYGHGFPFLQYINVYKNWKVDINNLELMNVKKVELTKRNCVYGDIFFTASSEVAHEVAMSSVLLDHVPNLTYNGFCKRFRLLNFDTLLPEFARFLFRGKEFREEVYQRVTGDTRFNISQESLADIPVLLPSIKEQKEIAHILGMLDDKTEVNQKMNRTLEEIAKAIFKSWFVDFDPVRAKMEGQPTGLPSDISDLFPDELVDSELGKIPKGWETKALDDIGFFKNGLALQKFPAKDGMAKLPVVKIAQLRKGNTLGDNPFASNVPSEYIINDGDFIFSWSGSLLAKYWVGGQGALNQHLFKVEEKSAPLWFVANWVHQHMPEFRIIAKSKATTMGHIKREHLREAICVVPPAKVLSLGQEVIAPLIDRSVIVLKENRILNSLRDTLLPKLISGQVRVPDAEKFLEETAI